MSEENLILPGKSFAAEGTLPKTQKSKLSVASLSAAFFVDSGEEQALPILWPHMYASLGASIGQLGSILGASRFVMTLMLPLWGYAADRFSRKLLLVLFTGIWGLWTMGIGLIGTLPQLMILRIVSGLGLGVFAPAAFSLIGDLFDNHSRGRAAGTMRAVGLFGTLAAVGFLPALAGRGPEGWRTGFILMGFASFITGLLMLGLEEPPRGSSEPELRDVISSKAASRYTFSWADLWALFRIRSWRYLLLNEMLTRISISVFVSWNFTFLTGLGLDTPVFYGTVLLVAVGLIFGSIFFGWLGDRLEKRFPGRGRITMIQIGLSVTVPLLFGYLVSNGENISWLIGFGFLAGFGNSAASEGTLWPVAQAIMPPELRGSSRAIITMVAGAASALMLSLSGVAADQVGVPAMLLWLVPLPGLLSIIAWIPMFRSYYADRAAMHELLTHRRSEVLETNK
jgi:MFS family permease